MEEISSGFHQVYSTVRPFLYPALVLRTENTLGSVKPQVFHDEPNFLITFQRLFQKNSEVKKGNISVCKCWGKLPGFASTFPSPAEEYLELGKIHKYLWLT